jgi:hypothetical protein
MTARPHGNTPPGMRVTNALVGFPLPHRQNRSRWGSRDVSMNCPAPFRQLGSSARKVRFASFPRQGTRHKQCKRHLGRTGNFLGSLYDKHLAWVGAIFGLGCCCPHKVSMRLRVRQFPKTRAGIGVWVGCRSCAAQGRICKTAGVGISAGGLGSPGRTLAAHSLAACAAVRLRIRAMLLQMILKLSRTVVRAHDGSAAPCCAGDCSATRRALLAPPRH